MKPKLSDREKRQRDQQELERNRIRDGLRIAAEYAQQHRQHPPVGLLNKAGAVQFTGLSFNTIGRAMAGGYLKSIVVGGRRMFFVVDLIDFMDTLRKASQEGKPIAFSSRATGEPLMPDEEKIRPGRPRKPRPMPVLTPEDEA